MKNKKKTQEKVRDKKTWDYLGPGGRIEHVDFDSMREKGIGYPNNAQLLRKAVSVWMNDKEPANGRIYSGGGVSELARFLATKYETKFPQSALSRALRGEGVLTEKQHHVITGFLSAYLTEEELNNLVFSNPVKKKEQVQPNVRKRVGAVGKKRRYIVYPLTPFDYSIMTRYKALDKERKMKFSQVLDDLENEYRGFLKSLEGVPS